VTLVNRATGSTKTVISLLKSTRFTTPTFADY
jgi:hypothetical protein